MEPSEALSPEARAPMRRGTLGSDPLAAGPSPRPLLTVDDLASLLGLSPRGARQVLERGELPGFRVGRRWFVRPQDLDAAFVEKVEAHRRNREAAVRILRGISRPRRARRSP